MVKSLLALAALGAVAAAQAQDERSLALTVYNQNFALVKDVRLLDLTSGNQTVRIDDVAASIDATSVHFKALDNPSSVAVLEQNFQYDLAGADRILDRYLNREVRAVMNDGSVSAGTLLSYSGGSLVLSDPSGGISIINRGEMRDIKLGELPGGLVVKPTLVWTLASNRTGRERAEVSYLTQNISWHAEYVAVVNESDTALDLAGWVSIDNRSGASYPEAKLKLVAGDVNRVRDQVRPMAQRLGKADLAMEVSQFQESGLFEYHVYALQRPATVLDRETKQLSLFPTAATPAKKVFTFDAQRSPTDVAVELEFQNRETDGLGMPLPAGKIRVFKKDRDEAMEFVGEDRIDHTPKDEKLSVYLGNAFDIKGKHTRANFRKISNTTHEETFEVEIRNHKDETVTVKVVEHRWGDWRVLQESHSHAKVDAHTMEYLLTVGANDTATVTYTVLTVQ